MAASSVFETIEANKHSGRGTLVAYLPLGFPNVATSVEAAVAALDNGADVLELGIPYSDPVMDGPVIAEATHEALDGGVRLADTFTAVREIVARTHKPVLVMTYWNPVLQYGVDRFAKDLKDAGGAGLITPDLIPDEAAEWLRVSDDVGLERVFLAAPSSTEERLGNSTKVSNGFVYAVSTMGITGARSDVDSAAKSLVERLRAVGAQSVCVGLGISTAEQVRDVLGYADGAIVGSALVSALREKGVEGVAELAVSLATGHRIPQ